MMVMVVAMMVILGARRHRGTNQQRQTEYSQNQLAKFHGTPSVQTAGTGPSGQVKPVDNP
jgi:hypothetical protein